MSMAVSESLIVEAVDAIADVEGLAMDPNHLVEDVYLLAFAFPQDDDFKAAVASTCRAFSQIVEGRVTTSSLKYDFAGWRSYHYQPRVGQGSKAVCRIVFRPTQSGIEVKGFGHRRIPKDLYKRLSAGRVVV
ncbi:hypothetical protein GMI70_08090 [Eggerthellaceae bacterium zg-893]|nr:hypothetical protein [Eggerthellaceae bacterium zg-893]